MPAAWPIALTLILAAPPIAAPAAAAPLAVAPGPIGAEVARRGAAFPYAIQRRTLENGLQVLLVRHPTPGIAAYFTMFRVGSRNEVEPGRSGFAHFFEHLTFRGSKTISGEEWERITRSLGTDTNAFTDDDITVYWLAGPAAALPRIVEIEADRFMNLDYREDDFQVESRAVLGELLKDMASPDFLVEEAGRALAFTRHTYRHTTIGFERDVRAMPTGYRYSLDLYRRFYRPDNAVVIVVGDFDADETFAHIRARYGSWRPAAVAAQPGAGIEPEPPQREAREQRLGWATPVLPRLWSAWHTPSAADVDATATQLVLWPLLFGRPSALHRDLVLEHHLVEEIGGEYQPHRDPYLFGFELVLKSADAEKPARAAVDRALAELAAGRVDERLVADVKENVLATLVMQSDTPYRTGVWLAYYTGISGDPGYLDAVMARVARVGRADLISFARTWLVPANRTTVVVAPLPAAARSVGAQR